FTTSLARSTSPDVRNCFVILFSGDVSAADLTSIANKNMNRTIMGPQMYLPKSLLDFMIAPLVNSNRQSGLRMTLATPSKAYGGRSLQGRIPRRVDPVGGLRGLGTANAVFLVVGRRRLHRVAGVEPRPAPAVSPERVAGMAVRAVPHHHEPALQLVGVAHGARRHRGGRGRVDLLHQHRPVGEVPVLVERGDRARVRVDVVDLLRPGPRLGGHRPGAPELRRPS